MFSCGHKEASQGDRGRLCRQDEHAVHRRALARRHADQLCHHSQGREENGQHRQDEGGRPPIRCPRESVCRWTSAKQPQVLTRFHLDMSRLPAALFVVDIKREHIAVAEAQKLGIPVFAIVDTNSDPLQVEFPIPGNDDASKSIATLMEHVSQAIIGGLDERKKEEKAERCSRAAKRQQLRPLNKPRPSDRPDFRLFMLRLLINEPNKQNHGANNRSGCEQASAR